MPTKKPVVAKKPVKKRKVAAKKTVSKKSTMQSFKVSSSPTPFLTFALTRQSLYWAFLSVCVLAMGVWILMLNQKVNEIYDQIDLNNAVASSLVKVEKG